ncbi:hypothetical protein ACLOJK_011329 [Asimina triloba]
MKAGGRGLAGLVTDGEMDGSWPSDLRWAAARMPRPLARRRRDLPCLATVMGRGHRRLLDLLVRLPGPWTKMGFGAAMAAPAGSRHAAADKEPHRAARRLLTAAP